MAMKLNFEEIENLMKSFYKLSGIRISLFDADYNHVIEYPKEIPEFCRIIKGLPNGAEKCQYSDTCAFKKSQQTSTLIIYKCHVGLTEATIALRDNEKIVGYLMFGQIIDHADENTLHTKISHFAQQNNLNEDKLLQCLKTIKSKTKEDILSAAKIMEACVFYVIYKELILQENNIILEGAKSYIENHLSEDICIDTLCCELHVGRTKLYEIFRTELNTGISKYILYRRMNKAKQLIKTTSCSIAEIAQQVGFADYNYFSRVFKKTYGYPPKYFRKS